MAYILNGISKGFRIGYDYSNKARRATSNLLSASRNPEVVARYIQEEVSLGRVIGPLEPELAARVHISPFGVIPKGHTGKWRLIVDLSSPPGSSVNDGIDPTVCSLTYISMDTVAEKVAQLGQRTFLAKVDVKSAYRIVPVNPEDRMLLGVQWGGGNLPGYPVAFWTAICPNNIYSFGRCSGMDCEATRDQVSVPLPG